MYRNMSKCFLKFFFYDKLSLWKKCFTGKQFANHMIRNWPLIVAFYSKIAGRIP